MYSLQALRVGHPAALAPPYPCSIPPLWDLLYARVVEEIPTMERQTMDIVSARAVRIPPDGGRCITLESPTCVWANALLLQV